MRGIKFMRFKVELNQKKTVLYKSRLIIKNTWSYKDPRKKVFFYPSKWVNSLLRALRGPSGAPKGPLRGP